MGLSPNIWHKQFAFFLIPPSEKYKNFLHIFLCQKLFTTTMYATFFISLILTKVLSKNVSNNDEFLHKYKPRNLEIFGYLKHRGDSCSLDSDCTGMSICKESYCECLDHVDSIYCLDCAIGYTGKDCAIPVYAIVLGIFGILVIAIITAVCCTGR